MLLTICPNCEAQFKVTPEQLNIRQGRVMCGRCRSVFNAFQSLERVDSGFLPLADTADATSAEPTPETYSPSLPSTTESYAPELETTADQPMPVLEEGAATAHDEPVQPEEPVAERPPAKAVYVAAQRMTDLPSEEYLFVSPDVRPHWIWQFGVVVLVLVLAGQSVFFLRTAIVSNYPETRAYLSKVCEWLSCDLPWNRDENALKVESSDLIEEIGAPGRFLLTATISNRAKTVQDFPHIELTLTDTNNQTLTRRVLQPKDYLGRPLQRDEGMAPASETSLNLRLEASSSRAAGYHLLLFFP